MTKLTILSANLWLLPPPATIDVGKRLDRFIEIAQKFNPDVINLQEVWLKKYEKYIKSSLPNFHSVSPKSYLLNKSGLVTLLKYKPISESYHQFPITKNYGAFEAVGKKGILRSQFGLNSKLFTIINTHIYESPDKSKLSLKLSQIKKVINWARKHNPTIISGDFNTKPEEFLSFLKGFIKEDNLLNTYCGENKYTHEMVNFFMNKDGIYNSKPNRVLLNLKSKRGKVKTKTIKSPLISDHYPLLAEVKVV